ncbi:beta-galactosidase [filamentous cyanobacterium LEGE 11480]|uniref:Beta-galactosidase n=1 Tax=Romeriopsis navalis LEGE 11480 TaxID=2777977 RepID=A0A928Z4H9_9CYAN|nr:beta-galactosidase [Romeriopsis navalis]MBE9030260.1 beta-galactosidase [Romeriopsis navalis LEGE 11480]
MLTCPITRAKKAIYSSNPIIFAIATVFGMKQVLWMRRTQRRRLIKSSVAGFAAALFSHTQPAVVQLAAPTRHQPVSWRSIALGTTFSPLQCYYLGLDFREAFEAICTLGLDQIRLGAYWNVIERQRGQDDFSEIDWLLDRCDQHNVDVVLAVGMKVPRWPEFHFPDWVKDLGDIGAGSQSLDQRSPQVAAAALEFSDRVVQHCRDAPAVKYWQVENEPFTQLEIAGGRFLSPEFVRQEIALVQSRKRNAQKILLTNAIHLPTPHPSEDEPAFWTSVDLADAVGLNVYTKVPTTTAGEYLEPAPEFWRTLQDWQISLRDHEREAWIAEAQAEPWELQKLVAIDQLDYPSATPLRMRTLVHSLCDIGYTNILLWGCEYWYWHKRQGQSLWWWEVKRLVEEVKTQNLPSHRSMDE